MVLSSQWHPDESQSGFLRRLVKKVKDWWDPPNPWGIKVSKKPSSRLPK